MESQPMATDRLLHAALSGLALRQRVSVTFERRQDHLIHAESMWSGAMACGESSVALRAWSVHEPSHASIARSAYAPRQFEWRSDLTPVTAGDWENYLRAAALAVSRKWGVGLGVDAVITSDLPSAAGLSSSSALIVAFALALLRANGWSATFEELMEILPEGEHFVGTRGGGMDHAAALASRWEGIVLSRIRRKGHEQDFAKAVLRFVGGRLPSVCRYHQALFERRHLSIGARVQGGGRSREFLKRGSR